MIELFSRQGQISLMKFMQKKPILAFDYDGTLVPIKKRPHQAQLNPATELLLEKLNKKLPLVIISGRSLKDLRKKFNFKPQILVGNHGIENLQVNDPRLKEASITCQKWLQQITSLSLPSGVWIENKKYTLTVHYRESASHKTSKKKILNLIEELRPMPQVILGKCVVNLLTCTSPHKGEALRQIQSELKSKYIFFVGDDDTDELVFRMKKRNVFSVCVGKKRNSSALFFIKKQSDIQKLLKFLHQFSS